MLTREDLERRKLELEVRELERSPWLRPAYMAALLPIVLATLGFLSAWLSGYFSAERAKLKQDTAQLELERNTLRQERDRALDRGKIMLEALERSNRVLSEALERRSPPPSPSPKPNNSN